MWLQHNTMWIDIASIVFVCVTANHLGLVKAIAQVLGVELRIVSCPKCFTFWTVLIYMTFTWHGMLTSLAISFLCAYLAIWVELTEGFIDTIYLWLYEKIYPNPENDTPAADADRGNSAGTVS